MVFFGKKQVGIQTEQIVNTLCQSGPVLFLPSLVFFYIDSLFATCEILIAGYLIFVFLSAFFRLYLNFFNRNYLWFYFILYLCALEIIPLYLLYKGFMVFFNCAK